jgi:hypothetical protein
MLAECGALACLTLTRGREKEEEKEEVSRIHIS